MKFLLQNGADVDAKLKFGFHYTAFHVSAFFGHLDLVRIFVKNGLNVNVRNSNEETPLYVTCLQGNRDDAEYLIDNGADVWVKCKIDNSSCLHAASQRGHLKVIKLLLEKGFDINPKDLNGHTPLRTACLFGKAKAAKLLLDKRANMSDINFHLNRALQITIDCHGTLAPLTETARILLENGADAAMKTYGLSPFHYAVEKTNLSFVKVVYDVRPNFDVKDFDQNNAIEFVLKEKQQNAMKIILFHFHKH